MVGSVGDLVDGLDGGGDAVDEGGRSAGGVQMGEGTDEHGAARGRQEL